MTMNEKVSILLNILTRSQVAKHNKNDRIKNQPGADLTTNTTPSV